MMLSLYKIRALPPGSYIVCRQPHRHVANIGHHTGVSIGVTLGTKTTLSSSEEEDLQAQDPNWLQNLQVVAMMSVRSVYSPWIDLRNKASTYR
jgi:hypothetical protein